MEKTIALLLLCLLITANGIRAETHAKLDQTPIEQRTVVKISGEIDQIIDEIPKDREMELPEGSYLVLKGNQESVYLHLGPRQHVAKVIAELKPGQIITAEVFQEASFPKNHYIVKTLTLDSKTIAIRDSQLVPFWEKAPDQ